MKRSAALAIGIVVLCVAALAAGLLLKTECPACAAVWVLWERPASIRGFVNPGCPRCDDSGAVASLTRWTRRPPDPRLVRLFRACWDPSDPADPAPALLRALAGGSDPDLDDESTCEAFFVHTNEDPLVAVASHPWNPDRHVWTLVLFDLDGAVLDRLRIAYPGKHAERPGTWTTTSQLVLRTFTLRRPGLKGLRFALAGSFGKRDLDGDALEVRILNRRFDAVVETAPP